MARIEEDGIDQAKFKVIDKMMTDVYTKIAVDLSYTDYINTYVSKTSFHFATFIYLIFSSLQVLTLFVIYIYRTILNCPLSLRGIKRKNTMVILKV